MPDTHTHTIESGNARVSVEADDAARAVSEARRNWAFNNGGDVSETVDDIARRIAEKICSRYDKMDTQAAIASVLAAELAPLVLRAEAAERERDKLAKFKAYVHKRLDDAGVPADPESTHKAEGCRVGGRLDCVFAERAPKWISTTEQVPDVEQKVLIQPPICEGMAPRIDTATWMGDFWQNYNWHRDVRREEVSWWMPLPALPAAKEGT